MELKYELTKDDYLAFNLHYMKHSKMIKQSLFMQRFLTPIIFLVLPFVLFWMTREFLIGFFITFVLVSIVWMAFYPKYFFAYIKKRLLKALNEGSNDNLLGQHVFIPSEDGLIEKNSAGERKTSWSGIERVEENDDYYFLFLSSMSAYILPKRSSRIKQLRKNSRESLIR
ncbi:YcxB family protein [Bacillus gobiensis]|uniref:YcxB-like C-terminal domain-containing protein n=1 Tax=Bacillus gobiensis TaxID=1441095 RepID=A0A0M4FUM1_9BACI|nr:YcxB family protein [Bacillus gobiensis]ALC80213.1 hypothetical protein AM592_00320 [Bacillus gobiensis]